MAIHKRRKRARSFIQASRASRPPGKIPVPGPSGPPGDYEARVRKLLHVFGFNTGILHKDLYNFMECANAIAEHYGWWSSFPSKAPLNKIAHHMDNVFLICKKKGAQMGGSALYAFQVACKKARPKKPAQPGKIPVPGAPRPRPKKAPRRRMGRP